MYPAQEIPFISAITLAELQHGLRRAKTPAQQHQRRTFLNEVLQTLKIVPLDEQIAIRVGTLDAEMAMTWERVDLADLIIAATAIETNSALITHNLRHSERIPNLQIAKL